MHRVPHREKDRSGCEMKSYSLHSPGGFRSGPRTLRPERLQWLTTSAVNRQAFMGTKMWSLDAARIARGASGRSIHEVDTVRSGALEDLAPKPKNVAFQRWMFVVHSALTPIPVIPAQAGSPLRTHALCSSKRDASLRWHDELKECCAKPLQCIYPSRAFRPFFNQNSDRRKAWQKHSPPLFFFTGAAMS